MSVIGAYLLGLATLPVLAGLWFVWYFAFNVRGRVHCDVCGYQTSRRPLPAWLQWRWHQLTIYPRAAHKQGVRECRIRMDRDPETGAFLPVPTSRLMPDQGGEA